MSRGCVKDLTAPKAGKEAAVAVTNRIVLFACLLVAARAGAKVLPEDRADVLYHYYDGGGVTVQGPSVLIRKAYKDKVSLWGHYYMDMVSGASIDVRATASKYVERRKEGSLGADYLYNKTLMGFGFIQSDEHDYHADTGRFNISQDFFGDLTTLSLESHAVWASPSSRVSSSGGPRV